MTVEPNQLREGIIEVLSEVSTHIEEDHPDADMTVCGVTDDAADIILDAVIAVLPEDANTANVNTQYWDGYNDGVGHVRHLLQDAKSKANR